MYSKKSTFYFCVVKKAGGDIDQKAKYRSIGEEKILML